MESNADAKKPQSSATDLFSSAKVVAEAAASAFRHDPGNVDKGNAANAAADLLHSASHYAKLEEKGLGTYVEKAEDFLRGDKPANSSAAAAAGEATQSEKKESGFGDYMGMAQGLMKKQSGEHGNGEEKSEKKESGFGDYMGMAQGLMKKQSGEHGSGEEKSEKESGFGDYMEMAQGLIKKHSGEHGSGEEEKKSEGGAGGVGDYMKMAEGFLKKN